MSVMLKLIIAAIVALLTLGPAQAETKHVLVIGDSISLGYQPHLAALLPSNYVVDRIPGNGQDTDYGRQHVRKWIGARKWDVISFNFGLWDLCYRIPGRPIDPSSRDKVHGRLAVPLKRYADNLRAIVRELKASGAVLVWQTTTAVPNDEPGRVFGSEADYNAVAASIMTKAGVRISDLAASSMTLPRIAPNDVHFTEAGYRALARIVAKSITAASR